MRLNNHVAIVTGEGCGLGEGICLCLAREGAHVVVSDLKQDSAEEVTRKIKEVRQKSLAIQTDVRVGDQCGELIQKSLDKMGHIDILVCGAGVGGFDHRPDSDAPLILENISEEDWDLFKGMSPGDVFNAVIQNMIPMRRPRTAEDIGNIVVFLASREAKEITGQTINVDGGAFFN